MPWHITSDRADCNGYAVVQNDNGKIVGCHKTRAKAKAQLAALNASEHSNKHDIWDGRVLPQHTYRR